ncbi:transglycosylase family protein [Geodermatophilus normandii]|uniref:transglycosylase family protein n=1 Tax=Geodermatophilus normandii TaxID=1137989 RepID=UPI001B869579|nr:transglycosylase family protein [Geodermatophilus normandii]
MPKHRAPRYVRTKSVIAKAPVAAGAAAVGLGVLSTPAASASAGHDWSGVAQCESSGNWAINTGNGYYGGLQFSQSTWAAFGGTDLAARADLATPAQQVQIAEAVLAGQGIGAWPSCGKYLAGGTTAAAAEAPAAAPVAEAPRPPRRRAADARGRHRGLHRPLGRHGRQDRRRARPELARAVPAQRRRHRLEPEPDLPGPGPRRQRPGRRGPAAAEAPAAPAAAAGNAARPPPRRSRRRPRRSRRRRRPRT